MNNVNISIRQRDKIITLLTDIKRLLEENAGKPPFNQ